LPSPKLKAANIIVAATAALLCLLLFVGSATAATASSTLTVSPNADIVGSKITVTGAGFTPNTNLTLDWAGSSAAWIIGGNPPQTTGINKTTFTQALGSVQTNASGSFSAKIAVPSAFGGIHFIQAFLTNGTALPAKATFTLEPSFHFSPTSGPAGTPITFVATGLSDGLYSTSYHLYWDNGYVGYMTALSTGGNTNFTIYASGTPGTHFIQIYQGYPGPGYLNPQQGPPASETQSVFPPYIPFYANFTVTPEQVTAQSTTTDAFTTHGAAAIGSFALLGALVGGAFFVYRKEPEEREAISRAIVAVVIVVIVVVAGLGIYAATGGSGAASSTNSSSQASSGPQVTFSPAATIVRPQITVPLLNVATTGPRISVTPTIVSVGNNITVNGLGFTPSSQYPLIWVTRQGNDLNGYKLVDLPLRNVTADATGAFAFTMKVPHDLGGLHFIAAGNLTQHSNGTLFIQRTGSISPLQGPQGTKITVTFVGIGWGHNTNLIAVDYDNSYVGYACGFNSGGNATVTIIATGAPGIHTIDVYPSLWWGPSSLASQLVVEYRYPLLTPQDHPELMPSFHFTFLITPG